MAAFLFLVQLLFIGTLIVPAYAETGRCNLILNASASNFTVMVTPEAYKANTTYLVTISDNRNHTDSKNVTEYLLQALSPQNNSTGEWNIDNKENCGSIETVILNSTQNAANWTSPDSNISSVNIRVYIVFDNYTSAEFRTVTLNKESETTTAPPTTTHNSVSMVQTSSFFIAVIQLPLLLVTSKLLS